MSEWKETTLGEFIDFGNGKKRPEKEGKISIYGGNGILGYCNEYNYDGETIIIGRVGAYCGSVYYEKGPIWVSDNALSAKAKNNYSTKFLYYFLKNANLNQHAGGSSHPLVTQTLLNSLEFTICSNPKEQKAIAEILSSLDDKIDLLHRQNKTLEAMAETLFRQWFVVEAKKDWKYTNLERYVKISNGVSYKSDDLKPSDAAMVTLKSFNREGGFRMDGFKEYVGIFKDSHIVQNGDLVVAHTDITQNADVIGNPVLVIGKPKYKTLIISMDLVKVESKFDWLSKEFLYFLMRTRLFKEHCKGYANGSTVLHLSKEAIPSFEFFLPPKDKIIEFTRQSSILMEKKYKNIAQISNIKKLRDLILPKLMSGEVKVKN